MLCAIHGEPLLNAVICRAVAILPNDAEREAFTSSEGQCLPHQIERGSTTGAWICYCGDSFEPDDLPEAFTHGLEATGYASDGAEED